MCPKKSTEPAFLSSSDIIKSSQKSSKHLTIWPDSRTTLLSNRRSKNIIDIAVQQTGTAVTDLAAIPSQATMRTFNTAVTCSCCSNVDRCVFDAIHGLYAQQLKWLVGLFRLERSRHLPLLHTLSSINWTKAGLDIKTTTRLLCSRPIGRIIRLARPAVCLSDCPLWARNSKTKKKRRKIKIGV